jgi:hypothetical protein
MHAEPHVRGRELLRRKRSGEAEAFGVFYREHRGAVLAFLRVRVRSAELAADLMAESFVCAHRLAPGRLESACARSPRQRWPAAEEESLAALAARAGRSVRTLDRHWHDQVAPIGLHRVTVTGIDPPTSVHVDALEAIDGTPVLDLKIAMKHAPDA